jgi:hypothetical protein
LTDRRKLLSPADRSRSEIATGAERALVSAEMVEIPLALRFGVVV